MSRITKYFRYISDDKERIDRWLRFYIHHRNLYCQGQGEMSFIKGFLSLQSVMITWLFLKTTFPYLENWVFFTFVPFLIIGKVALNWYVGHWWDRNRVFDKEADWGNSRNPISKTVSKILLNGKGITK